MTNRQKKLLNRERVCVGCADSAKKGFTLRGHKMLSVTCVIWRKGRDKKASRNLRATSRVNICEECFVAALMQGTRSKVPAKLFAALRERLSATYNAMRKDSPE